MPATIFNGAKVKALKETLSLNGASDIISSASDPTVSAVDAPVGSLLLNNSSGKLYKKLDAGSSTNWQEVGAGAGGKNYIAKGAFDTPSTSGWSLTHSTLDATSKLPNQASGSWTAAAGTLSITTVGAGSQLSLLPYSLSLVSSAATTAGDMLITDALALDLEAQASVQTFSFFYKVASGGTNLTLSGTSTNSLAVAIYDVTNGAWIDPAGRYNVVQVSGVAKCAGTFQVPSNCTSVRLAVYFPNASAGAATVYFDDFYLGPQTVQYSAPVTDMQTFTPTGTWTTNSTYTGRFRRVGDMMHLTATVSVSGAPNVVLLRFNMPTGYVIDTSKLANTDVVNGSKQIVGNASILDSGVSIRTGTVLYESSTTLSVYSADATGDFGVSGNNPIVFGSGDAVSIVAAVPILGWSSSVQMSNDTDTRVVAAKYGASVAGTIGTASPFRCDTKTFDTHGAVTTGAAWKYTAPVPGFYKITALIAVSTAGDYLYIYKNGTNTNQTIGACTNATALSQSGIIELLAGDYVDIRTSTNQTVVAKTESFISVERLSGPSAIAANETVAARYVATGNRTPTSAKSVNYDSKVFDTHGAVTTVVGDIAGWKFTCPINGKYSVSVVTYSSAATVATLFVAKNGTTQGFIASSNIGNVLQNGTLLVDCVAGDFLDIRSDATPTLNNVAANVLGVSIHRIGN